MSEKIEKTLRKLATATEIGKSEAQPADPAVGRKPGARRSKGKKRDAASPAPVSGEASRAMALGLVGDPNCPHCHGLGYLRRDLPVGHPDFGKLEICSCRHGEVAQRIRQKLFSLSNLERLSHLTFENFQPRGAIGLSPMQADSLERAYNQAHLFSGSLNGWLLLQGGYGCGKTHLAAAIANFAVNTGVPTLFITVPDLLDTLRFAFDDPESSFEERFEQIRTAPLLVMDDFGTHNATQWAQEKLFQIINHRYINKLPLVVTTNLSLADIEGRIRSRLEDPELVTTVKITAPDFRNPVDDMGHSTLSSLGIYRHLTFSSWDDRRGEGMPESDRRTLDQALKVAVNFAKNPGGWLVFTGPHNCGKTHLAAAIANACADLGNPVVFANIPELLDSLRSTFDPHSTTSLERRLDEIRTAPLLIFDDLGAHSATPWATEKIYQIFNFRYVTHLPTVITTAELREKMDERLRSRMEDRRICVISVITAPGYRGEPELPRRPARRTSK